MAGQCDNNTVFVKFSDSDEFTPQRLAVAIRKAAVSERRLAGVMKDIASVTAALRGKEKLGEIVEKKVDERAFRNLRVVIHIDEAHSMADSFAPFAKSLHTKGIGCPCVVLFTGLGHTKRYLKSIGGLSRLADETPELYENTLAAASAFSPQCDHTFLIDSGHRPKIFAWLKGFSVAERFAETPRWAEAMGAP